MLHEALEMVVLLLGAVLCLAAPSIFRGQERLLGRMARRPWLAAGLLCLFPIALRLAVLPLAPVPEPRIHDEFSFLLQAETFASGRLSNPPHPFWRSFETVYTLHQPTYASQYQMGQGLLLAAGMVLAGHPWAAVLASMGILCALLAWMLRAWLPPRWALLGGLLAATQLGVLSYWTNTYWGGQLPGIGGTLVLGALARLRPPHPRALHAVLLGLGLAILAHTRPAEGFLVGLAAAAVLAWRLLGGRRFALSVAAPRVVLPLAMTLVPAMGAMACYNWKVTGDPLRLPYQVHREMYGTPLGFFWEDPVPAPTFRHRMIEDDYRRQLRLHQRGASFPELARATGGKAFSAWVFFVGGAFTLPLLFLPWIWKGRGMGLALLAGVPLALDHLTFHAFYPHYAAPGMGLIILVLIQGWRRLRSFRVGGSRPGRALARAAPAACLAGLLLTVGGRAWAPSNPELLEPLRREWEHYFPEGTRRRAIERELERTGERHLIFVRYPPGYNPDHEWVYNRADIDASRIVWAREVDPATDAALREWFSGRKVWLLEVEHKPPRLSPHPPAAAGD